MAMSSAYRSGMRAVRDQTPRCGLTRVRYQAFAVKRPDFAAMSALSLKHASPIVLAR